MTYYAGINVSLDTSSICIVDVPGAIRRKFKVEGSVNPRANDRSGGRREADVASSVMAADGISG